MTASANGMEDGHEKTVLSVLMNRARSLDLEPDDFSFPPNRTIFEAISAVDVPELLSVQDELKRQRKLSEVGGAAGLTAIYNMSEGLGDDSIDYALEQVLDASRARRTKEIGAALAKGDISAEEAGERLTESVRKGSAPSFSVRTAAEVLALPRNEKSCLLGDRLLALGQALVIAGVGGIGKTRLLLQLLVSLIVGCIWCGIETHARGKRCLLLQTENSTHRLQDDLQALRDFAGDDWPLVAENLLLHTLEHEDDMLLSLGDPLAARRLEAAIRQHNPDIVAFDPLRDFALGDLNSDADMAATVREIGRISRAGNPDRALVILHHALTGRAGAAKAFGIERTGFARNSKMLQTWTRGLINIVPGSADDNETLVLTCGKNSNGREFAPVAARLNPATMIYEVDEDFDIDSWRGQLASGKPERRCFDAELIRDLDFPEVALPKKAVVKLIRDETRCGISRAYELVTEAVKSRILTLDRRTKTYAKA